MRAASNLFIQCHTFFALLAGSALTALPHPLTADEGPGISTLQFVQEEESCSFDAPKGWRYVEPSSLPPAIKIFVKGKGNGDVPPTLNLAVERTALSLSEYLQTAKSIFESSGYSCWTDLGTVETAAGKAQLVQIEQETEWGELKIMQAVVMRNQTAYIMSAAALKEEFPDLYENFFRSFQSFSIEKNVLDRVNNEGKRSELRMACQKLKDSWPTFFHHAKEGKPELPEETVAVVAFEEPHFQDQQWKPFKHLVASEYADMGADWQQQLLKKMQQELLHTYEHGQQ